jgi:hypothetical protein
MGLEQSGPLTIEARGELPKIPNGYNVPPRMTANFVYPGDVHVVVATGAPGVISFEGESGTIAVSPGKLEGEAVGRLAEEPLPADAVRLQRSDDHMANFLECVRMRRQPISDVVSQHRAAAACHLANIAVRLQRKLTWDAVKEQFVADSEADAMLRREPRAGYGISL